MSQCINTSKLSAFVPLQAVFGCYSAVALADAQAVQALAEKLPFLFKHRSWQTGAYQVRTMNEAL